MEKQAEDVQEKELTPETWREVFDEENSTDTPIGRVKMGDGQVTKFFVKGRTKEFGMVAPTLKDPDVIISEASEAKDGKSERNSSYVFIKAFNRNGKKIKFYASITVKQDGMEVSVSSHYMNKNAIERKMLGGNITYIREALRPNSSDWHLAEHQNDVPDLLPTQGNNASAGKGTANSQIGKGTGGENVEGIPDVVDDKPKGKEKASAEEPKPVGKGAFGAVYDQFKGKVKEAFDFLAKKKSGIATAVFHRTDLGDIALVWGDNNGGLYHIIKRHIEEQNDFPDIETALGIMQQVVDNGSISRENPDKVVLDYNDYRVVVRKQTRDNKGDVIEKGNWIVTAFDSNRSKKEKTPSRGTLTTPPPNQEADGVTLPPNGVSVGKGTANSASAQETGVENSQEGEETGTKPAEEAAKTDEVKEEKPKQPKGGKSSAEGKGRTREETAEIEHMVREDIRYQRAGETRRRELAEKQVKIVEGAERHGFKTFAEAREWAKGNIARTLTNEETGGKGSIRISNTAVAKFLSEKAVRKSDSKDIHLAVLKVLPDVIRESVDAEQHPDYKKDEVGNRSAENGINENVTIHRLYGAVNIGDKTYRVKTTLKEDHVQENPKKAYSYEATKIELLPGQSENPVGFSRNDNNSISGAKLLEGVEKSYEPGRKLLDESENIQESGQNEGLNADDSADGGLLFRGEETGTGTATGRSSETVAGRRAAMADAARDAIALQNLWICGVFLVLL